MNTVQPAQSDSGNQSVVPGTSVMISGLTIESIEPKTDTSSVVRMIVDENVCIHIKTKYLEIECRNNNLVGLQNGDRVRVGYNVGVSNITTNEEKNTSYMEEGYYKNIFKE